MVTEYAKHLENRDIYPDTNRPYSINDISEVFKDKVKQKVINDRYYISEEDGTAYPNEEEIVWPT